MTPQLWWIREDSGSCWRLAALLLLLAILATGLYANTLGNDFVLDDTAYIQDNFLLRDLSNLPKFFNVPEDALVEDLPPGFLKGRNIRWVTFAVDQALGGGSPFMFHASNIWWHFVAAGALFFLFRTWLGHVGVAFFGAAIFLAHPVQTAAVAYISGRKDILATCFVLLAFLAVYRYRKSKKISWLVASMVSFFLAYFSKEGAVIFPVLLLVIDYYLVQPKEYRGAVVNFFWRSWKEYSISFFLAGLFVWHTFGKELISRLFSTAPSTGHGIASLVVSTSVVGPEGNLSYANLMAFYLGKLFVPIHLLADYRGVFHFSLYPAEWGPQVSLIALALFLGGACWLRRVWPMGGLGLCWIVVALLPVSHLIDFHFPVAEHYLYLPCAGFALLLSSGLQSLNQKLGKTSWILAVLLLVVYSTATVVRNRDWRTMRTIIEDVLEKAPDHGRARNSLVFLLEKEGRTAQAIEQGLISLRQFPDSPINHYNLGILYSKVGDVEAAVYHYRYAIGLRKNLWDAYLNLADLLFEKGREHEGYQVINQLTSSYSYHPLAYWVLGNEKARQHKWEEALDQYRRVVRLDAAEGLGYLGIAGALWETGNQLGAEPMLRKAFATGLDLTSEALTSEPWHTFLAKPEVKILVKNIENKGDRQR